MSNQDVNSEQKSTEGTDPDRRDFLRISGVGLLSTYLFGSSGCSRSHSRSVEAATSELETKLAPFREQYLLDGSIPDQAQLNDLFLQAEHLRFIEGGGSTNSDYATFCADVYDPFRETVGVRLQELLMEAGPEVEKLTLLKQALFEALDPALQYNKINNSVLDPLVNDRLQCRSATQLFLQLAREFDRDVLEDGEKMVVIYTDTHELAGKLNADNSLIGFEMTDRGAGMVPFGDLASCQVPMRVCHDDHVAAQAIFGTRIHQELVIVHDTLAADSLAGGYEKPVSLSGSGGGEGSVKSLLSGAMNAATECFGYSSGNVEVPEGDRPLAERTFVSAANYQRTEAPVPSIGASSPEGDLINTLPARERQLVLNYLQHNQYFKEAFERHVGIIQDSGIGRARKQQQLEAIIDELDTYWAQNNVAGARDAARTVLSPRGLVPTRDPARIFNTILHNQRVFERGAR